MAPDVAVSASVGDGRALAVDVEHLGGDRSWVVSDARLVDTAIVGSPGGTLPVDQPDAAEPGRPRSRRQIDESLVLAKHFEKQARSVEVMSCTGEWRFPVSASGELPTLHTVRPAA